MTHSPTPENAVAKAVSGTEDDVSVPTGADRLSVQNLVSRGAAALLLGSDDDFLAQLEEAAALSPQRRYQAEKLLIERGLGSARDREGQGLVELYVLLARAIVTVLEREPSEPLLLNYAGVIFYELWSLDAARMLFLAARRLDPELPHLADNIAAIKARRQSQRAQLRGRRAPQLHPALAELSRRAQRLAPRARPATGLRLSLCMIVKDEEEMLGRCLAAATPAVDEIVIIDTGSRDRTIEIAHEYGALVLEREWTGSFAEARNASFDAATGDWILYLDADEVLVPDDVSRLRALRGQTWREAFFLHETNFTGNEEAGVAVIHSALRVFRNRPEYRFSGRLHEQIAQTLPTYLPERIRQSPVRIDHYGYLGSVRAAKEKSARNVELLLAARAEGGPWRAFDHFNLGSEYMALENFSAAAAEYEHAWSLATDASGAGAAGHFVPALAGRLVSALRQAGRPHRALECAEQALALYPDFTDLVFQQGLVWLDLGDAVAACEQMRRAIAMGDAPSRYTAIVGSGTFLPRIVLAEQCLRDGAPDEALALLRWCALEHPRFVGTYHPYALALMASGLSGEQAAAEIHAGLSGEANTMIRFILATALVEGGALPEAAAELRLVLARRPDSVPAMELLAETLLMSQAFEEFATVLERFQALALDDRDLRERLAQMYLRHGFLRSAAREWMAVIERAPDAPALAGLAEVARRNGQTDAAAAFSAEALKYSTL